MTVARPPQLSPDQIDEFLKKHIPYLLGIMKAHKALVDQGPYTNDPRFLNATFLGSLMAGRMLLQFLGVDRERNSQRLRPATYRFDDDVSIDQLRGTLVDVGRLNNDQSKRDLLVGFLEMAHKAGGHITLPADRDWPRTHEALALVEDLLRSHLLRPV